MSEHGRRPEFPALYAMLYPMIARVGRAHGYAIALHGSMARDMDLIAAPWTDDAVSAEELVEAICQQLGTLTVDRGPNPDPEAKPHGRLGWALHLVGSGGYIDLSVMPRAS